MSWNVFTIIVGLAVCVGGMSMRGASRGRALQWAEYAGGSVASRLPARHATQRRWSVCWRRLVARGGMSQARHWTDWLADRSVYQHRPSIFTIDPHSCLLPFSVTLLSATKPLYYSHILGLHMPMPWLACLICCIHLTLQWQGFQKTTIQSSGACDKFASAWIGLDYTLYNAKCVFEYFCLIIKFSQ